MKVKDPFYVKKIPNKCNKGGHKHRQVNVSNLHKAVITRFKSTETLKNRSFAVILNQNPSLHNSFDAKN